MTGGEHANSWAGPKPPQSECKTSHLIGLAHNRQTVAYGGLSDILGFAGAGVFAQILGLLMTWCHQNGLPLLTAVVVGGARGTPGTGLATAENFDAAREEVYAFQWYRIFPPSLDEFRAIAARG